MTATTGPAARPGPVTPVRVEHVIVPLGSSAFGRAALAPGASIAHRLGARLHVASVGIEPAEAEALAHEVGPLAASVGAEVDSRVHPDVACAITELAGGSAPAVVCMASHARGRLGGAVLGSFGADVVTLSQNPVILVGPHAAISPEPTAPVLVCVDGSSYGEQALPVAARWAAAFHVPLSILTVAEDVPSGLDDRPAYRGHGPDGDPEAYVAGLVGEWRDRGLVDTSGVVLYDPISPAEAIARHLDDSPATMVVVTTHARRGIVRLVMGSQAAAIVRASPVPVLVVHPEHGEGRDEAHAA